MEAPHCKICQTKHWARDGHAGMSAPRALAKVIVGKVTKEKITMGLPTEPKPKREPKAKPGNGRGRPKADGPSKGKSGRAEYQRELMRKKRAAAKAKAT